ncbi:hypothetical protein [Ammoniphilus sp. YIM 78166]|uniref:hypothetical protein n=1 Tax=Ammoniphilus sp. YIM 78166 TaxID=1644106 RepID=UPI00106F7C68|nr:hypothetical protein [Ammoniphilus sp. YIM 78166]
MSILMKLSSEVGDKTEEANRQVAAECIQHPEFIAEIAEGLQAKKAALAADCAEVMTKVAEVQPQLIVPFAEQLISLLDHKTTKVRWEAMHAISLIAYQIPHLIHPILLALEKILHQDSSTIVRDYTIDTLSQYARAGEKEAQEAFPILREALTVWEGKHRGRVLQGLVFILNAHPGFAIDIRMIAQDYLEDSRGVVKKAAKALLKLIG